MPRGPKPLQGRTEASELEGFRKRISALLKTISPTQVARISGLAASTPTQWARGLQEPTLRGAGRLVESHNTCLGWLTGDGPEDLWNMIFPEQASAEQGLVGVAFFTSFAARACSGRPSDLRAWRFSVSGFAQLPPNSILITRPAREDDDDGYYVLVDTVHHTNRPGYLMTDVESNKRVFKIPLLPSNNFTSKHLPRQWTKAAHRVIHVITVLDI